MKKHFLSHITLHGLFVLCMLIFARSLTAQPLIQALQVSENKRFLVKEDGTPFFYLGDTAWELFHRLNREEADRYLKNRADKGFTVIQAVVLAELDGLHDPNPYGNTPLVKDDPTKPQETYFTHVDYIVDKAAELGMYIGLLPTWGDKLYKASWGIGPEIFNPENAKIFGKYLGNRYKNRKNIIWIMGGDRNPRMEKDIAVWRAMAEGVTEGVGGKNKALISFHPQPPNLGSSSQWFHREDWLDFNMFQTGHCRDVTVWDKISQDYHLIPTKPTMDGEPIYEDHPVCFNAKELGYSTAHDVRKSAYLNLFAGAHGHTYGCHSIWQMYTPARQGVNGPLKPWNESLDLPGAANMQYVRQLIESRPMLVRVPDQSMLADAKSGGDRIQATRGEDYLFVYSASGQPFTLTLGKISGSKLKGYWYNPREGTATDIGEFNNSGTSTFQPPSSGIDNDWVLVLDDIQKKYGPPGKA